jgi:hypothetical protein
MGKKEFDFYLFIDYSENYLGYLVIEKKDLRDFIPKISKFDHYRKLRNKKSYLNSIHKVVANNNICSHLCKLKIRKNESTPEVYSDILEFLKGQKGKEIFVCVDNKQFINFRKLVKIFDGDKTKVVKESELKKHSQEYKISLVLDSLLNLTRLKDDKF